MYKMYTQLNSLRRLSACADKQVACIITDRWDNILSVGINEVHNCVQCHITGSKVGCQVTHAEVAALAKLSPMYLDDARIAYVSLFPCPDCQRHLEHIVDKIVVFGNQHKELVIPKEKIELVPNLALDLWKVNGEQKQLSVIISELAELIKAITDYFYRRQERGTKVEELVDEVIDVEMMIDVLLSILADNYDKEVIFKLSKGKDEKLGKIRSRLQDGTIKRGSPYSNSFE